MMQRKYILFVALVLTGSFAIGQGYKPVAKDIDRNVNENKKYQIAGQNHSFQFNYSSNYKLLQPGLNRLALQFKPGGTLNYHYPELSNSSPQTGISMLQPDTYYEHLGFFCRKEIQLQKITTVPVKFRLGSYDYVNWLEGK